MDRARFTLALPDEPALLDRLVSALAVQEDPPITVGRSATAVLAVRVRHLGRHAAQSGSAGARGGARSRLAADRAPRRRIARRRPDRCGHTLRAQSHAGASAAAHRCDRGRVHRLVGALWTLISPAAGLLFTAGLVATVLLTSPRAHSDLTDSAWGCIEAGDIAQTCGLATTRVRSTASENAQRDIRGSWSAHGVPLFDPLRHLPIA